MKKLRKLLLVGGIASLALSLASANVIKAYAAAPGSVGSWTGSSNTLPAAEATSASVTYNGYVYVVGGVPNVGYSNAVYSAPLNANGTVGSWTTETNSLPVQVNAPAAVTYDGYIYVMGGVLGAGYNSNVYVAQLNNGTVGTWTTAVNTLPLAVYYSTADVYNGYVYLLGGEYSGGVTAHVYTAPLTSGGGIGSWSTATNSLPQTIEAATSVINNGILYVLGGSNGFQHFTTIYYSTLGASGGLGTWTTSSVNLPDGLLWADAVAYNGYVYEFGGYDNSGNTSAVYSAPFNSDGTLGTWATSSNSLPQVLDEATAVMNNGYVYIIGGNGSTLLNTVYYSQLTGEPAPGISNQTSSLVADGSITVNVLAGITGDPDPSTLSIVSGPSHGTAYDPPGTITYTPNDGYIGVDSLVYQVCSLYDESLCSQATLTFDVTSTSPAAAVTSPDTGFGEPNATNPLVTLIILTFSTVSLVVGSYLNRRNIHKRSE